MQAGTYLEQKCPRIQRMNAWHHSSVQRLAQLAGRDDILGTNSTVFRGQTAVMSMSNHDNDN
jgi:hypothetical protein